MNKDELIKFMSKATSLCISCKYGKNGKCDDFWSDTYNSRFAFINKSWCPVLIAINKISKSEEDAYKKGQCTHQNTDKPKSPIEKCNGCKFLSAISGYKPHCHFKGKTKSPVITEKYECPIISEK